MTSTTTKVGLGLMAFAVLPTPDDVTIVSPIILLVSGAVLALVGSFHK